MLRFISTGLAALLAFGSSPASAWEVYGTYTTCHMSGTLSDGTVLRLKKEVGRDFNLTVELANPPKKPDVPGLTPGGIFIEMGEQKDDYEYTSEDLNIGSLGWMTSIVGDHFVDALAKGAAIRFFMREHRLDGIFLIKPPEGEKWDQARVEKEVLARQDAGETGTLIPYASGELMPLTGSANAVARLRKCVARINAVDAMVSGYREF